jgi:DNA-dependent RNA polymerase auxiliary subunit epsilon
MSAYKFTVPCHFLYEIEADTEEQARKLLRERGGFDIDGELVIDEIDYRNADLEYGE